MTEINFSHLNYLSKWFFSSQPLTIAHHQQEHSHCHYPTTGRQLFTNTRLQQEHVTHQAHLQHHPACSCSNIHCVPRQPPRRHSRAMSEYSTREPATSQHRRQHCSVWIFWVHWDAKLGMKLNWAEKEGTNTLLQVQKYLVSVLVVRLTPAAVNMSVILVKTCSRVYCTFWIYNKVHLRHQPALLMLSLMKVSAYTNRIIDS